MRSSKVLDCLYQASRDPLPELFRAACADLRSGDQSIQKDIGADVILHSGNGSTITFWDLVAKLRRPLFSFLYRMVHQRALAEELAEETFLLVYRARHAYASEKNLTAKLYKTASELALKQPRDHQHDRIEALSERSEPDDSILEMPDPSLTTEQTQLQRKRLAAIQRSIDSLPDQQRISVLMHRYQGLDYRQIGDILGLSESSTKSTLLRAYRTLREKLDEFL